MTQTAETPHWRDVRYLPRVLSAALPPERAAAEWVEWMQSPWADRLTGEIPWSGASGVWRQYLDFCRTCVGCHPQPANVFAQALGRIVEVRQVSDYSTGRRRRLTIYVIPFGDDQDVADAPGDLDDETTPEALRLAA